MECGRFFLAAAAEFWARDDRADAGAAPAALRGKAAPEIAVAQSYALASRRQKANAKREAKPGLIENSSTKYEKRNSGANEWRAHLVRGKRCENAMESVEPLLFAHPFQRRLFHQKKSRRCRAHARRGSRARTLSRALARLARALARLARRKEKNFLVSSGRVRYTAFTKLLNLEYLRMELARGRYMHTL